MPKSDRTGNRSHDGLVSVDRIERWAFALLFYYLTSVIVLLGLSLGADLIRASPYRGHTFFYTNEVYANWDGQWYIKIAAEGYAFDTEAHSSVAFFPAYPLLGRLVAAVTGLRYDEALMVTSNAMLAATFVLLAEYLKVRVTDAPPRHAELTLMALGLVPTSFFFRVAYSESLFIFLTTLTFYGMRRRWSLLALAIIIGLATATRAVGVALIPALAWHTWRLSPKWPAFVARIGVLTPLACWGLVAYMAYLYAKFGDPLAFARTQIHWRIHPPAPFGTRILGLVTFEPIRSLFDPSGTAYALTLGRSDSWLFSLRVADSLYFLGAMMLVIIGAAKRWLAGDEVVASIGMLLIPYATIGYDQYMQSMGRYSAGVLPAYLVLGHLLCRVPGPVASAIAAISGFFLGVYAAMFAAWHVFI